MARGWQEGETESISDSEESDAETIYEDAEEGDDEMEMEYLSAEPSMIDCELRIMLYSRTLHADVILSPPVQASRDAFLGSSKRLSKSSIFNSASLAPPMATSLLPASAVHRRSSLQIRPLSLVSSTGSSPFQNNNRSFRPKALILTPARSMAAPLISAGLVHERQTSNYSMTSSLSPNSPTSTRVRSSFSQRRSIGYSSSGQLSNSTSVSSIQESLAAEGSPDSSVGGEFSDAEKEIVVEKARKPLERTEENKTVDTKTADLIATVVRNLAEPPRPLRPRSPGRFNSDIFNISPPKPIESSSPPTSAPLGHLSESLPISASFDSALSSSVCSHETASSDLPSAPLSPPPAFPLPTLPASPMSTTMSLPAQISLLSLSSITPTEDDSAFATPPASPLPSPTPPSLSSSPSESVTSEVWPVEAPVVTAAPVSLRSTKPLPPREVVPLISTLDHRLPEPVIVQPSTHSALATLAPFPTQSLPRFGLPSPTFPSTFRPAITHQRSEPRRPPPLNLSLGHDLISDKALGSGRRSPSPVFPPIDDGSTKHLTGSSNGADRSYSSYSTDRASTYSNARQPRDPRVAQELVDFDLKEFFATELPRTSMRNGPLSSNGEDKKDEFRSGWYRHQSRGSKIGRKIFSGMRSTPTPAASSSNTGSSTGSNYGSTRVSVTPELPPPLPKELKEKGGLEKGKKGEKSRLKIGEPILVYSSTGMVDHSGWKDNPALNLGRHSISVHVDQLKDQTRPKSNTLQKLPRMPVPTKSTQVRLSTISKSAQRPTMLPAILKVRQPHQRGSFSPGRPLSPSPPRKSSIVHFDPLTPSDPNYTRPVRA